MVFIREAKKGGSKKDTAKKSTKPKRWESFKGVFAVKQRSQSPAPLDTLERKKVAKKSFMDRFKTKKAGANQLTPEPGENKRPLSFTGADEKNKDTLDVFSQFEVSKSLPSSPVSKKKKIPSRESPPPYSPMSMSSGSPFTGGATTEDSQQSTPSHVTAVVSNQDARTQQQVTPTVVGQEIQIRVDVEDTTPTPIPTIVEPSETVETGETATTTTTEDTSKPTEPAQPEIVVEQEPESAAESPAKHVEPIEPVEAVRKDVESPTKPAEAVEPAASVAQEDIESSTKPAEPEDSDIVTETEAEEGKSPVKTVEPAVSVPKESESPTEPVTSAVVIEKEPEKPALPTKPVVILEKETAERKNEKPSLPTKPAAVTEDVEKKANKPTLAVKRAAVKEKDAEKSEKPSLPVKPTSAKAKETESKSAKPVLPAKPAIVTEPVSPSKHVVIVEPAKVEKVVEEPSVLEEPSVPKYLKDRKFQWDRIREVLETAPESTENSLYSELPPQEATWMEHSSPMEQLRAFLMVCP